MHGRILLSALLCWLGACGGDATHHTDAGTPDASRADAGDAATESGAMDAALDLGDDASPLDLGRPDAGRHDGGGPIDPPAVCPSRCRYVRADAPAGGDGSDWDHAMVALPATLTRGFVYFVSRGSYPAYTFDDAESGTMYIGVRKGTPTDHGTDVGWMDAYAGTPATFAAIHFATGYVVFDGRTGGGPDQWDAGLGFEVTDPTAVVDGYSLVDYVGRPWNVVMRHVDIHPTSSGGAGPFVVLGIADGGFSGEISRCYVHDLDGTAIAMSGHWNGLVLADNYVARARFLIVAGAGLTDSGSDNVTVRDNLFEDVDGVAVISETGGPESADGWNVHGNVFAGSETGTAATTDVIGVYTDATSTMTATNWRVYDNSFVNLHGHASVSFSAGSTGVRVDDNLWFCNYTATYDRYVDITGATHDYDYFASCVLGATFVTATHEPTGHTVAFGSLSDPTDDPFVDWRHHNYRLHAPLAFGGLPYAGLADPAFDDTDPVGRIRGADGVWDRGAFEL